jgi:hypothetical protein
MRKWIFLVLVMPTLAFAVEPAALLPPEQVMSIIDILEKLPYIGLAVVFILKWIAVVAPIMTAIS